MRHILTGVPGLTLLVLYVADLEQSLRFYSALGIAFTAEKHGAGPRHYAAEVGGAVLELYPSDDRPHTRTRLGLRVNDLDATRIALAAAEFDMPAPRRGRCVVRDQDGNVVELSAG